MADNAIFSEQDSPFLKKLPAELRNRIYEDVLTSAEPIQLMRFEECWSDFTKDWAPPLLRTCHQIREEARGIFFRANAFLCIDVTPEYCSYMISMEKRLAQWLKALAEKDRLCIERIYLDIWELVEDEDGVEFKINECYKALVEGGVRLDRGVVYLYLETIPREYVNSRLAASQYFEERERRLQNRSLI